MALVAVPLLPLIPPLESDVLHPIAPSSGAALIKTIGIIFESMRNPPDETQRPGRTRSPCDRVCRGPEIGLAMCRQYARARGADTRKNCLAPSSAMRARR